MDLLVAGFSSPAHAKAHAAGLAACRTTAISVTSRSVSAAPAIAHAADDEGRAYLSDLVQTPLYQSAFASCLELTADTDSVSVYDLYSGEFFVECQGQVLNDLLVVSVAPEVVRSAKRLRAGGMPSTLPVPIAAKSVDQKQP